MQSSFHLPFEYCAVAFLMFQYNVWILLSSLINLNQTPLLNGGPWKSTLKLLKKMCIITLANTERISIYLRNSLDPNGNYTYHVI
jgi:hypothetical protein